MCICRFVSFSLHLCVSMCVPLSVPLCVCVSLCLSLSIYLTLSYEERSALNALICLFFLGGVRRTSISFCLQSINLTYIQRESGYDDSFLSVSLQSLIKVSIALFKLHKDKNEVCDFESGGQGETVASGGGSFGGSYRVPNSDCLDAVGDYHGCTRVAQTNVRVIQRCQRHRRHYHR